MKELFAIVLATVSSMAYAQVLSGDSWASAKSKKRGNIAVVYTHAPKFAEKKGTQHTGLCFAIMNEFIKYVKKSYGVSLSLEHKDLSNDKDFALFLQTMKKSKGGVFGLADITITEARKKHYHFSSPYFSNVAILATSNKVPTLSSMKNISKEFAGKIAIVQKGTTHEARMSNIKKYSFPNLNIKTTTSYEEANKKVATNTAYFTYIDFSTYLDVISKRIFLKRHEIGDMKGEEFGIVMPKSSDWKPIFDEFMAANGGFTKSVTYRKLLAQNLGNHVLKLMNVIIK